MSLRRCLVEELLVQRVHLKPHHVLDQWALTKAEEVELVTEVMVHASP